MAYKKLKYWFDIELAKQLVDKISVVDKTFKGAEFLKNLETSLDNLELKDRIEKFADALYFAFDEKYNKGISTLLIILGPENEQETGMFKEFYWIMPIAKFVEKYGINDFEKSMTALEEITKRNTSEYAIRPFIEKYQDKTLKQITEWSKSDNKHVRRLSSEGIRPRLPWAKKLDVFIKNPKPLFLILNNLKDDKSKYVQKSVANCINDILKDNFEVGKEIIDHWNKDKPTKERKWIIKHALRNLIKSENKWALDIIISI